jgi:hypothetical protein
MLPLTQVFLFAALLLTIHAVPGLIVGVFIGLAVANETARAFMRLSVEQVPQVEEPRERQRTPIEYDDGPEAPHAPHA